jgi:hypothetical protein
MHTKFSNLKSNRKVTENFLMIIRKEYSNQKFKFQRAVIFLINDMIPFCFSDATKFYMNLLIPLKTSAYVDAATVTKDRCQE